MPKRVTLDQKRLVLERLDAGYSYRDAAKYAGVSVSYIQQLMKGERLHRQTQAESKIEATLADPLPYVELSSDAKDAWDNFGFFQERYFGRIPLPWQAEAIQAIQEKFTTPNREYMIINCPPGAGKTLLFSHDLPIWLTVRNRAIRGQFGAAGQRLANQYVRRMRKTLELVMPMKAKDDDLIDGTAHDAVACLAKDFGRFRPVERDYWTNEGFTVLQHGGVSVIEKEPTWSGFGIESGFIGGRYDVVVWDDLVDPKKHRSETAKRQLEVDWDNLCESRLEPRGLMFMVGQRLFTDDLYRYNLDKRVPSGMDDNGEPTGERPKYFHVKFPAHFTSLCSPGSHHPKTAKPYGEGGCLLSPKRLTYQDIKGVENNRDFEIVYQQEDVDPRGVLVPMAWIKGDDGHIGCLDPHRQAQTVPGDGQMSGFVSILTVDPSPTNFWAVEHWLYHPESEQYFLFDLIKKRMEAPDFLGYNIDERAFYGVAEDMVNVAALAGVPITHLIVENNAAQRFLAQYDHFKVWCREHHVIFIPHGTGKNKSDPALGVETVAPLFEFGHVRLPMEGNYARVMSLQLINEVTKYTGEPPDDALMAFWFMVWNKEKWYNSPHAPHRMARPSWMVGSKKPSRGQVRLFGGQGGQARSTTPVSVV